MRNKPQTIADLKFNWTFDLSPDSNLLKLIEFNKLNSKLEGIKIKGGHYEFYCNDKHFTIYELDGCYLNELIWDIGYFLRNKIPIVLPLKLLKFELIAENTFKIHVEEVKE